MKARRTLSRYPGVRDCADIERHKLWGADPWLSSASYAMATITDWTDKGARAYGCSSVLQQALQSALLVPKNEGVGYTSEEYIATWACRFSSDGAVADAAKKLWPTLNSYGVSCRSRLRASMSALTCGSLELPLLAVLSLRSLRYRRDGHFRRFGGAASVPAVEVSSLGLHLGDLRRRFGGIRLVPAFPVRFRRDVWVSIRHLSCSDLPRR